MELLHELNLSEASNTLGRESYKNVKNVQNSNIFNISLKGTNIISAIAHMKGLQYSMQQ